MVTILAGSFNLLSVHPGLVFWTIITFLTVLLLLWLFAWKPIIQAIDVRNDKVENDLKESERLREEAKNLLKEYEEKIENSQKEASKIIEQSKIDAESVREKILKGVQEESKELRERVEKEIEQAKENAIQEIKNSIVDTTITILSKILKKNVGDRSHGELILNELKTMPSNLKN